MQAYEAGVYMLQNRGCEEITGERKTPVTHRLEKKKRDYETKAPPTSALGVEPHPRIWILQKTLLDTQKSD